MKNTIKRIPLIYGENPHQKNAAYEALASNTDPLALHKFKKLEGKKSSLINMTDLSAAINTLNMIALTLKKNRLWVEGETKIAVVVKHGTPCGFGYHQELGREALRKMISGDPQAAFGGVIVTNFPIGMPHAEILKTHMLTDGQKRVYDLIAAPEITEDAITFLARKDDKCRIYENKALLEIEKTPIPTEKIVKQVRGGNTTCNAPRIFFNFNSKAFTFEKVSDDPFTQQERIDICIAHAICATSASNTITYFKDGTLLANTCKQQSRVHCIKFCNEKLKEFHPDVTDFVVASDSFFPFTDGPELIVEAGAKIVVGTSGSKNYELVKKVFKINGVCFITIADVKGRLFYGH